MNVLDPIQVSLFIQNVFLLIFIMLICILVLGVFLLYLERKSYSPRIFISIWGLVGAVTPIKEMT